jgi:hypothetical protein
MINISERSSEVIQTLDAVAQEGERQAFVTQVEAIDWSTQTPDDLARTIDLALRLELATLAIALAMEGQRLFPDHARIQHAARVLAPPVRRIVPAAPVQGLDVSRSWVRDHADAYRGQWVALREGALLGAAPSLKGLLAALGPNYERANTVVTRVL